LRLFFARFLVGFRACGRAAVRSGRRRLVRVAAGFVSKLRCICDPGSPSGAGRGGRDYLTGHKRSSHLPSYQFTYDC